MGGGFRRYVAVVAIATAAIAASQALAIAQPPPAPDPELSTTLSLFPVASPTRGSVGTQLTGRLTLGLPDASEYDDPAGLVGWRLLLPRGLEFNGDRYPICSGAAMRKAQSVGICPKRAIVGSGHRSFIEDEAWPVPTITYVNGGARRIWAFVTLYHPALVRDAVAINIRPLRSRRWAYELTLDLPLVLRLVAGVPVIIRTLDLGLGGQARAAKYLTVTHACPNRDFRGYRASATYQRKAGPITVSHDRGRMPCR
jgi:hypothetical protein